MIKKITLMLMLIFLVFISIWKSPNVNKNSKISLSDCIHREKHKHISLRSMGHSFQIYYIENASKACVNPNFPIIQISSSYKHNAWIQIVRMDSLNPRWRTFIDSTEDGKNYPLYSIEPDFFDSPLMVYSLLNKPKYPWIAHAYAVIIDDNRQIQKIVGGIEWGYKIGWFDYKPQMISPRALDYQDFKIDEKIYLQHQ